MRASIIAILRHLRERIERRAPKGWCVCFEPTDGDLLVEGATDDYELRATAVLGFGTDAVYRLARTRIHGRDLQSVRNDRGELVALLRERVDELARLLFPPPPARYSEHYARLRRCDPVWSAHA